MNLQQIMRPSSISADGIKVFAGAEQDANLFFITVEAKLIAAGIDAGIIAEGGADHQGDGQAPAAASSPSPSTHGASGPRTRSRAQRGPRRTGARHNVEDHDDDDDDEGDGDDHGAQPSSSSSSLPSSATPSGGAQVASRASGLLDPRDPQVDAAIFAFLLGVLTGHPLRLAITDNRGRSGVLALRRLRERYIRSGKDHVSRLRQQLSSTTWLPTDTVDTFMSRITDINSQLLAAGVSIPEDDLRTLVRNESPRGLMVAMPSMEREDPPPSLSKNDGGPSSRKEARLLRPKKRTPPRLIRCIADARGTWTFDTSGDPCCPPADRDTCSFCNFRGHCAQQCRKLQAAKRYHVIDVRQILSKLRNHGNGNGKRPGSSRPQHGGAAPFKKAAVVSHGPQRVETFAIHHDALMLQPEDEEEGTPSDHGATAHITSDASLLTNYIAVTQHVTVANSQAVTVIGKGDAVLRVAGTDGAPGTITLKNVLHVPDIKYNLLALNLVTRARRGASVVIAADDSRIQFATWSVPLLPSKDTGHLFLYASTTTSQQATALAGELVHSSDEEAEDADEGASAHDVLGHRSSAAVDAFRQQIVQACNCLGTACLSAAIPSPWHGHRSSAAVDAFRQQIAQASSKHIVTCGPCALGKSTRASIPKQSAPRSAGPCQLLYADIAGPLEETSLRGARYALTFIDDCTRFAWTFLIRHKNDVGAALEQLRKDRHVVNALRGATLQTDSDAVFKSQDFTDLCVAFDIKQRFSPPHSQAKNGSAERTFRTLFETARTMLFAADLDKPFWGFAVQHATLLHNIAPRRSLKDKSPFEALTGHPFDVSLLRVFGSPAYVHVEKSSTRHKLDPRSRVHGVNSRATFASTATIAAIRTMLAMAVARGMDIQQMDVNTAFLNAPVDHEIYVQPPAVDGIFSPNTVLRLKRGLYGLKQSPRLWNHTLDAWMREQDFVPTATDACIYRRTCNGGKVMWVAVYVDDLLIFADSDSDMAAFKKAISKRFKMKDLGSPDICLGIKVQHDRKARTVTMSQEHYLRNVLESFGMADCKPVGTPLCTGYVDKPADREESLPDVPFRELLGSLLYAATMTRPDISAAVSILSRRMQHFGMDHWKAAKHLLRYIKGTLSYTIKYAATGDTSNGSTADGVLSAYSDASFASDVDTRRSRTGFVVFCSTGPVSWNSKLQATVATASADAEYMALAATAQELMFLRQLQEELTGAVLCEPTLVHTDNQPAQRVAEHAASRMRHILVKYHYIRECVDTKRIVLSYLATEHMIADLLTKILPRPKTAQFCTMLFDQRPLPGCQPRARPHSGRSPRPSTPRQDL
ncbi:hypothetical protein PTSG_13028 [Salpingoeca rosetta]|uniref:Integrase catalytic domain-containing protein n=1 Tax=Salpingoeca rosetta (strain ATCC 50818 / BSB-021) TaxID=946362 RepID=F2UR12_SALR5|nr:uncharacterized protein PTSG_13028 [Salpingoeca rosetta]EGD80067.1 hypothetical protein PTSG_13028 [Salpingoeca rosetta]|eukprot:XP_004988392.1 hypothetical protein PTSG_13028 [Salpingoeca rosetta]